jgi:hypothetical protein
MKYYTTIILMTLIFKTMARELKTEIIIHAKPENIWNILVDIEYYPNWNPFIVSITGDLKVGSKIKTKIALPNAKEMTFKPEILVNNTHHELRWIGHLFFSGLFDGEHRFELFDNGDGTTTFRQSESFRGILAPFFKKMIDIKTKAGFELMNLKLKELAELD